MKYLTTAFLTIGLFSSTAVAQDGLSEQQKTEVNAMIRAYILENPEIIPEAITILQKRDEERRLAAIGDDLFTGPGGVIAGNPNGSATIVEFFDYRCPYCRRGWQTIKKLLDEDKDLRVVFRQFPIKDAAGETISRDAALAAMASDRQGKYLEFHNAIFTNPTLLSFDRLIELAKSVGLDTDKLKKDMKDPSLIQGLDMNLAMARTLRLTGTPAYIIGDTIQPGLIRYADMKDLIAAQRSSKMAGGSK